MNKIKYGLTVLALMLSTFTAAEAQVSIGISLPSVSIGINLPLFPDLVQVQGYPVYYAPGVNGNYFFYDGLYWVYENDNWYASSWYNGPWGYVEPEVVPLFILRVPVRYYRQPPVYFRGWYSDGPPRWHEHWGRQWEQRHRGWDRWDRRSAPSPAPLPTYQRRYSGDRYPRAVEQQQTLRRQEYRYQPRDRVVREHFQRVERSRPAPDQRDGRRIQRSDPPQAAPQRTSPAIRDRKQQPDVEQRRQRPEVEQRRQQPDVEQRRQQPDVEQRRQQPDVEQRRQQPDVEQRRQQPTAEQRRQQPAAEQRRQPPTAEQRRQQQLQDKKTRRDVKAQEQEQKRRQEQKDDEERGRNRN